MSLVKHIVAVIGRNNEHQSAVNRAVHLAQETGASLHLVKISYHEAYDARMVIGEKTAESIKQAQLEKDQRWLDHFSASLNRHAVELTQALIWHKNLAQAVAYEARDQQADLIVTPTIKLSGHGGYRMQSQGWDLVRRSPCAVLFATQMEAEPYQRILAAVELGPRDTQHDALSDSVVKYGKLMRALDGGDFSLVTAYPYVDASVMIPADVLPDVQSHTAATYRELADRFAEEHEVDAGRFTLDMGDADEVIETAVRASASQLLIIGTVARSGLQGFLVGNTAKRVMARIHCDVLCVKPQDHITSAEWSDALD